MIKYVILIKLRRKQYLVAHEKVIVLVKLSRIRTKNY